MTYREARIQAGMTMKEAAERLGVSKAAVSLWETGKGDPLMANHRRMAELYGVPLGQLTGTPAQEGGNEHP